MHDARIQVTSMAEGRFSQERLLQVRTTKGTNAPAEMRVDGGPWGPLESNGEITVLGVDQAVVTGRNRAQRRASAARARRAR